MGHVGHRRANWLIAGLLLWTLPVAARAGSSSASDAITPRALALLDQIYSPDEQPETVIREDEVWIEHPAIPGERLVLSTVGVQHEWAGTTEFHPLVAILIDRTFTDSPEGEWLAIWNLGSKSPGFLSRLRAALPGFTASKKVRPRELNGLLDKLERFEELESQGKIKTPKPYLKITQKHRRSTAGLILSSVKRGLSFTNISWPAQVLFRSYLLRNKDLQEREFEHAYLGLSWYQDLSGATETEESLGLDSIEKIKFQLLTDRHILGRWVDPEARENYVHGFEAEIRDHLWGTSCFLASAANDHHLAYEELRRVGDDGVPLALGGILYYDPELAPEPDQVRWGIANPFDLTYNPFTDERVLRAASDGTRVPLAIYVYQSNLALKPIVAVDFFNPDNPRIREAATYWRKMGNEAISAAGGIGLLYSLLNRAFTFVANRKELTWFGDKKLALGIEELRLSLLSHLYFEPPAADQLADRVDRVVVNPLVQPARLQAVRAQLHYRSLLADEGAELLRLGRALRLKNVRKRLDKNRGVITSEDYETYRSLLVRDEHLKRLRLVMRDKYLPSVPFESVAGSLRALASETAWHDRESIRELMEFRFSMEDRPPRWRGAGGPNDLLAETDQALADIYRASGWTPEKLRADLETASEARRAKQEKHRLELQKRHTKLFARGLKEHEGFLRSYVKDEGDLTTHSPWYLAEAIQFFREVPVAVRINPQVSELYAKRKTEVEQLLAQVENKLAAASPAPGLEQGWLEEQRVATLRSLRTAQSELRAALDGPPAKPAAPTDAAAAHAGSLR